MYPRRHENLTADLHFLLTPMTSFPLNERSSLSNVQTCASTPESTPATRSYGTEPRRDVVQDRITASMTPVTRASYEPRGDTSLVDIHGSKPALFWVVTISTMFFSRY